MTELNNADLKNLARTAGGRGQLRFMAVHGPAEVKAAAKAALLDAQEDSEGGGDAA